MKYTKNLFIQHLINNIPEYKKYWLNDIDGWLPSKRTLNTETGTLLHFMVDEIEEGRDKYLPFIFDLVEDMLKSGDEAAEYAAYMMFLESLNWSSSHSDRQISLYKMGAFIRPEIQGSIQRNR
ncbi:MAG: hypothetical protein AB8B66_06415 [Rickettsiaceae bacterium]